MSQSRERLPYMDADEGRGLYTKYRVQRRLNPEKHRDCEYFVLDLHHDKFSIAALQAYADECEGEFPLLARDLRNKLSELWTEQVKP